MKRILIFLILSASCLAQNARMLSGVNYQSGTSYALQPSDVTQPVVFNNASAVAVCLSSPFSLCSGVSAFSGGYFSKGAIFTVQNNGAGTVTITCSSCTINGSATLALASNQGADIYGDGTNYTAVITGGPGGSGTVTSVGATSGGGITVTGSPSTTPNVGLTTACANGQVLAWNGSAWACSSAGTGTGNVNTCTGGFTCPGPQSVQQPLSSGVTTVFGINNNEKIRNVDGFWNQPQTDSGGSIGNLSIPGSNTLTLTPCWAGIDAASASHGYQYSVYISGTGTAEAVPVIGGTCTPGASSGTIIVTTLNTHSAGFTVGSASTGIQEAWNDCWISDSSGAGQSQPCYVKLMASTQYFVHATVTTRGRNSILDGSGAYLVCSTRSKCIKLGTAAAPNGGHIFHLQGGSTIANAGVQVSGVSAASGTYTVTTVQNHTFSATGDAGLGDFVDCELHFTTLDAHWVGRVISTGLTSTQFEVSFGAATAASGTGFGWCNLENTFIEDGSSDAVIEDINLEALGGVATGQFTYGFVDDNDQTGRWLKIRNDGTGIIASSANWPIGAMFYSRNDQNNEGVMFITADATNNNFYSGGINGAKIADSVCQGEPSFCIRYFGSLQPAVIDSMYQDQGSLNPLYGQVVQMGMLTSGSRGTVVKGNLPLTASAPQFVTGGSTANQRNYYAVPRSSVNGYFYPMFFGSALPTSGAVSIPLAWPSITMQDGFNHSSIGTLTWDILVTIGQPTSGTPSAPFGTGTYALATNVSGACSQGMCTFTDTQPALSTYTVQPSAWYAQFWYWPAVIVNNNPQNLGPTVMDSANLAGAYVSASGTASGGGGPQVIAGNCFASGSFAAFSSAYVNCPQSESGTAALNLFQVSNQPANSKGRVNFGGSITAPNDLITLEDSNAGKTKATAGGRPSNDANDVALGKDQSGGLSERAPTSISNYIGTLNDNSSYLERLTSAAKTFNVPVSVSNLIPGQPAIGFSGPASGATLQPVATKFYVTALPNAGTTPDTYINNCEAWALTSGGLTCDASMLNQTYTFTHGIRSGRLVPPSVTATSGGSIPDGNIALVTITLCSQQAATNGQPQGNCPATYGETPAAVEVTTAAISGTNQTLTVASPANTATTGYFGSAAFYNVYEIDAGSTPNSWTEQYCSTTVIGTATTIPSSTTCAGSTVSTQDFATELILPAWGTWNCNITNGTDACLTLYSYSWTHGLNVGIGGRFSIFNLNGSTNAYAICSNDQDPKRTTSLETAGNFTCQNLNNSGGTMTGGSACVWSQTSDTTRFDNVGCTDSNVADVGHWIWGGGAGETIINLHGSGNSHTVSCELGKAGFTNAGTYGFGWSCPAAGGSSNNFIFAAGGGMASVTGLYMEEDVASTVPKMQMGSGSSTPVGVVRDYAVGAAIAGSTNTVCNFSSSLIPGTMKCENGSTTQKGMPLATDQASNGQNFYGSTQSSTIASVTPVVGGVGRFHYQDSESLMISDDFVTGQLTSGSIGSLNWNMQGSAACGTASQPAGSIPNIGLFEVQTGASSGNTCGVTFATAGALGALGATNYWDMTWVFKVPATTNAGAYVGWSDSLTTVPANFAGFAFDTSNSAAFRLCVIVASTSTCDATTYTADTNFHRIHLWGQSLSGGTVTIRMQFDGNAAVTFCTSGCTDTVTPTTNGVTPIAQAVTRTTSAQQLIIDYFAVRMMGLVR
jgi:hypothetical protein